MNAKELLRFYELLDDTSRKLQQVMIELNEARKLVDTTYLKELDQEREIMRSQDE